MASWFGELARGLFVKRPSLLEILESDLLPHFSELTPSRLAQRFPNGPVDLEAADLIIRLERERGYVEVLFSSQTDPLERFGWAEVAEYLGVAGGDRAFTDPAHAVAELRELLRTHLVEIMRLFARLDYSQGRRQLLETRRVRNNRLAPVQSRRDSDTGSAGQFGRPAV